MPGPAVVAPAAPIAAGAQTLIVAGGVVVGGLLIYFATRDRNRMTLSQTDFTLRVGEEADLLVGLTHSGSWFDDHNPIPGSISFINRSSTFKISPPSASDPALLEHRFRIAAVAAGPAAVASFGGQSREGPHDRAEIRVTVVAEG